MTSASDYAEHAGYVLENPDAESVIVLLHGLGADHNQPMRLLAGFRPAELAVLAPDLRAHGETDLVGAARDYTFPALASDIVCLLERVGQLGKPTHLMGISMGAAVALRLALRGDIDVRSVTFIRPAFSDAPMPSNLAVMSEIGTFVQSPDLDAAREAFAQTSSFKRVEAVSVLAAKSLLNQFDDPRARDRALRLTSVPKNVAYVDSKELATVTAPALVVGTHRDPVHPATLAHTWAKHLSHSELRIVPPRDESVLQHEIETQAAVQSHLLRALA